MQGGRLPPLHGSHDGPGSAPLSDHPKTVNLREEPVVAVLNGWIRQQR